MQKPYGQFLCGPRSHAACPCQSCHWERGNRHNFLMETWQGFKRPGGIRNTANIFGKYNLLPAVLLLNRLLGIRVSDFYSVKRPSWTKCAPSKSLCRSYIWRPCKWVHPSVTLYIIRPLFLTNSLKPHPVQWLPHNPSLFLAFWSEDIAVCGYSLEVS